MGVNMGKPMIWSQCVWVRKMSVSSGPFLKSVFMRWSPRRRMPEPASIMTRRSPQRTSRQEVSPPKATVSGPGVGIEPRSPQMRTLNMLASQLEEDLGLLYFLVDRRLELLERG